MAQVPTPEQVEAMMIEKMGVSKDPTMLVDDEIFIEGLIQSEEITKKFEKLLKG